jgi:hypothetical protein
LGSPGDVDIPLLALPPTRLHSDLVHVA